MTTATTTTTVHSFDPVGDRVAWTVDDGTDPESIRRFALFAEATGTRITIFPCFGYPGWREHAALWRPMVQSGQVQVGNHTWSHTELVTLDDEAIVDELERNEREANELWGVTTKPWFRPPNGLRDDRTDAAARSAGWTWQAMWNGLLDEGRERTVDDLLASVGTEFAAGAIVIGHANTVAMQGALDDALAIVVAAGLTPVTLADVFGA